MTLTVYAFLTRFGHHSDFTHVTQGLRTDRNLFFFGHQALLDVYNLRTYAYVVSGRMSKLDQSYFSGIQSIIC